MSAHSLIDLKSLTAETLQRTFLLADQISSEKTAKTPPRGLTAALVFFEPSTRTRMSFETACLRENLGVVLLDGGIGTSLEKGETPEDTLLNIAAMNPSLMVVRCKDDLDLGIMAKKLSIPIFNGGWGKKGHPTQALLDAYAIRKRRKLEGQRVLLIGDIRHSRVASSHFELASKLGYEIALCGPKEFIPEKSSVKTFATLKEGLQWATVAMAFRVQLERHTDPLALGDFHREWGLNDQTLKDLSSDALIMHPGPVNWGVELAPSVAHDPRTIILDQVSGGVWIRQALIRACLTEGER